MNSRSNFLALVLLVGLTGCSDDDDNGGTALPTTGTVVINPQPAGIEAPWEITGPDDYSADGSGQEELTGRALGDYTVTWSEVAGWHTPSEETQALTAGSTVSFTGAFIEEDFVYIPPGTFTMGSPTTEPQRNSDETQHPVTLTQGFYMSKYEVTEQWWYQVMGGTPTTSQSPKNSVSWDMAVQFCNAMSVQESLTPAYTIHGTNGDVTWNPSANGYRLPTEAEWEYACRATTTLAFNNNTNCLAADTEANYDGNNPLTGCPTGIYRGDCTVVGHFPANEWGLYDMHGNLWEWVWDGYRADYENLPSVDPVHNVGPGALRVLRGGYWYNYARYCRSAARNFLNPNFTGLNGFRPVRSAF